MGSVPQAFICKTDYPSLALAALLGKQATVFLHVSTDVCKRLEIEMRIERRQTLQLFACAVPVASVRIEPAEVFLRLTPKVLGC